MDALFVGFLTTYSHTYSAAQKMLAAYYARRYITSIAATHRSDRVSGSAVTTDGSLKITFLRINWCQVVTSWQLLNE